MRRFLYNDVMQLPGISRTNSAIVLFEGIYPVVAKVARNMLAESIEEESPGGQPAG